MKLLDFLIIASLLVGANSLFARGGGQGGGMGKGGGYGSNYGYGTMTKQRLQDGSGTGKQNKYQYKDSKGSQQGNGQGTQQRLKDGSGAGGQYKYGASGVAE